MLSIFIAMLTLREYRKAEGLTLKALAAKLGVHLTTVHKWEAGSRLPDARAIVRIERLTASQVGAASFVEAPSEAGKDLPVVRAT